MKHARAFLIFTLLFASPVLSAAEANEQPRLLVHLLEYIAADYPGAVENGKVKSAPEYAEQKEFVTKAAEALAAVPNLKADPELATGVKHLEKLVLAKASADEVAKSALKVKNRAIQLAHIEVSPTHWPSLARGKASFQKNCVSCHGQNGHGDGPGGKDLDPKPGNFHDPKMASVPPFQAFNTIRLGVPGTGMAEFPFLSDNEVWDLAFYVTSFKHENSPLVKSTDFIGYAPTVSLKDAAVKSDEELEKEIGAKGVALLRLHQKKQDDSNQFLALATEKLEAAAQYAAQGKYDLASKESLLAYLDGIEPVEPRLRSKEPGFITDLEMKMLDVRSAVDRKLPSTEIDAKVALAKEAVQKAQTLLDQGETSPAITFSVAAGIFLREAFEAVLILITILGVLKSVGAKRGIWYVHAGWITALLTGLAFWFTSGWLMQISGAQRELLEGGVSLLAVIVLLYFGFWLHRKTEIGKWRAFISEMLNSALDEKSLWALFGLSFMAVFREAFETVLFLRAVLLEAEGQQFFVAAGVIVSLVIVIVLASLLLKFSAKIPVRQLFDVSSVVMALLAVILVGKAVHSFQEIQWMSITELPFRLHVDLVGIYPTYETLLPQIAVLALAIGCWFYGRRPQPGRPA